MSERSAVQEPMLKYADEIGWQVVSSSEAMQMRNGNTATLYFTDVLKAQLLKLNKGAVDASNCDDVIRRLGLLNATLEGNQEALLWMRGERSTFVASENRNRNATLIDFNTPDNNLFHVTDEWEQQNAAHRNRADVVFLINGIPVAVVETKNAGKPGRISTWCGSNSPLPQRNPGDVYHCAALWCHTTVGLFLRRDMEHQSKKSVQLENRRIHQLRTEGKDFL